MNIILVPTDFSENALHALKYAQELYKNARTEFYILHAFADKVYGRFNNSTVSERKKAESDIGQQVEKQLDTLIQSVKGVPSNPLHTFHAVASFDSLVDGVNDFVNKLNLDLIVMGTKGETSDHKTTFGSYTIEVFKYVKCPVLAIPQDFEYKQPKLIMFPTDYMLPYKRRELKLLGNLAGEFKSEVHCVHISDFDVLSHRQEDNKLFLKRTLAKAYLYFKTIPVKNRVNAILEYIAENNVDMLAMVNSRHSFFEDMLYRSSVDELGLKIKIPFLVMQNLPR
ncbi:universal stress protein [Flagellimonas aquimarina]|uniref:Universal stress protein n=1 Tax=Flagellimonas aquimarina TaxID=2201895 RepID=A0A316LC52_9FLAO|nr:universal stress protein [Allomuricauda koreensis]PWL37650.1 universal stress protein [Allomuricauda koreensis]